MHGVSLAGTEADLVSVEACFEPIEGRRTEVVLSGLPDPVVRESRARLLAALAASRLWVPQGRLVLHLAPAGLRKGGEGLDLPLALGAAAATGHLVSRRLPRALFLGELGIDGRLHAVRGGLAAAELGRREGLAPLVAPATTAAEAQALPGTATLAAGTLGEVVGWAASGEGLLPPPADPLPGAEDLERERREALAPLAAIHGQPLGKRALLLAAAGGHGLLFFGPPGTGKSRLARALAGLLPPPDLEEQLVLTRIASATGGRPGGLVRRRPFRAPHASASHVGLVGGGSPPVAGEVTRAHGGVLFLDELPEFRREALEALRQPLEEGRIGIARAGRALELPARFQLVAAMNPCPCGMRGHPAAVCRCSPQEIARYRRRISGPLLDRIDLRVELVAPRAAALLQPEHEPPERGAERVAAARGLARARQGDVVNARLDGEMLERHATPDRAGRRLLARAAERAGLSARGLQSLRRVARTVADLEQVPEIGEVHVAEALALRARLEG